MSNGNVIFKSRAEQRVEAETGLPVGELLRRLYHEDGLNQEQIAARLSVGRTTVIDWMKRHGVPTGYNRSAA